jgi:DNA mismatch repair protein MutS2
LSAISFREQAEALGLQVSLAKIEEANTLRLEGLFNPLLFRQGKPVPNTVIADLPETIMIITGPNSGGKTRLLQAVGLAQLLGQSGIYVPAATADLPLLDGLFASITERATVDQAEGRLGTELLRIRELFEAASPRSMLIMDELCSGTNPSEAEEIVLMVLQLLERLKPVALITTHFLGFGRRLRDEQPVANLRFLQVDLNKEQRSTYQFVPGVAETSLAAHTAKRLGVTFEELSALVDEQGGDS